MTQKITPNLWFDGNALEAAEYYTTAFPGGKIVTKSYYPKTAEEGLADFQMGLAGELLTVDFDLGGLHFVGINAGADFVPNPSISFMVNFDPSADEDARENLDALWGKLVEGGEVLMPLDAYPFSKRYGWVKDRYGFTWQLILTDPAGEPRPFIVPSLMFTGKNTNKAEEAINFYVSLFEDSRVGTLAHYLEDTGPANKGSLMFGDFMLAGQWFASMDSAEAQAFTFNEAISLSVDCKDQAEIDAFWAKLSDDPQFEQCGWCKDRYGVSWQIVPENMSSLMEKPNAFAHMMEMKKLVIEEF